MAYTYNIILGANIDSEPVVWKWAYENALAVAGKGGSGKTTSSAYWLSQLAAQGVRFLMCDPHMAHKESLYAQTDFMHDALLKQCAGTHEQTMEYIQLFHSIGAKRITNEETNHYPLMLVIDEFTSFVINYSAAKSAVVTLLDSLNQLRKCQMKVMLLGQTWGQALKTISSMRDALSSTVVLRSSYNDAAKFCASSQTARDAMLLTPGEGFYQDEKIWIPQVTSTGKLIVTRRVHAFKHTPLQTQHIASQRYKNEENLLEYAAHI